MAKKTSKDNGTPAAPRRASTRRTKSSGQPAPAPVDIASVTPTESIHTVNDRSESAADASHQPTPGEIAQAAYLRYLGRGGTDGRDFDDWIEAERELANRHAR